MIFVQVGLAGALRQHLGHAHQGLGIIGIDLQHFASHVHHLVGIVRGLVRVHGVAVKEDPQFAVGKLGGEVIRRFFQGCAVGAGRSYFVGVKLGLSLGLGRALARGRRGGGRGTRRRRRRRLGLRRYECSQRQYHD